MTEPPQTPGQNPDWGDMKDKVMAARGPDRLILIAGALYFVNSFLPWYGVKIPGFASVNFNAWDVEILAWGSVILAIAATVLAAMQALGKAPSLPMKTGQVYLALGGGTFLLVLLRFLTEMDATKFGLYFALILGAVLAYGGYMKYKAEN